MAGGTEWGGGQGATEPDSSHSGKGLQKADTYNSSHFLSVLFISLQSID